jgi:glycyl-tRNA synthetase beta chain
MAITNQELLLEIGCEELPAWAVRQILDFLRDETTRFLDASGLSFSGLETLGTPRRIVLQIQQVSDRQQDRVDWVTGPPRSAAFDKQGQATRAATGFAAKCGVEVTDLQIITTPKGEYLAYQQPVKGRGTGELLAEFLPTALKRIQFRKPMYWTEDRFIFIRPIRWILALLGGTPFPVEIAGITSGQVTYGHRVIGNPTFPVHTPGEFLEGLRQHSVMLDPIERKKRIVEQLNDVASKLGGRPHPDDGLLEEVVFLNECPNVIYGAIPREFLSLPAEVLMTVMRHHQKYFAVEDAAGNLLPYFLVVIDRAGDPQDVIRKGHERVLRARLNDAAFFWKTDTGRSLESLLPQLQRYQFHLKLGSYYEKTRRIQSLSLKLAELLDCQELSEELSRASLLCKTDLATDMVKELPELQGIMGGLYARKEGMSESVWTAIYDHYMPLNLEERTPRNLAGALVSIADRADTLAGCFGIGMAPKGSSDPFALRRHAQGLMKILWEHQVNLTLDQILTPAFQGVAEKTSVPEKQARGELMSFLERRLRYMLQQRGFAYDVINAVLAVGYERPLDVLARCGALQQIRPETDFLAIAAAYKRVKNILNQAASGKKPEVDTALLTEDAEKALYAGFRGIAPEAGNRAREGSYYEALKSMATLRSAVDRFFDQVLVMSQDERLRANRLSLLAELAELFRLVADISEIVVEGGATASVGD